MEKPGLKFILVNNFIMNAVIGVAMSVSGSLLSGVGITARTGWQALLGFVLGCVIHLLVPVPRVMEGAARLCRLRPDSLGGRLIGNGAVTLIFLLIMNFVMTAINVPKLPEFFFAFCSMLAPQFVVLYLVALVVSPIAQKVALAAEKRTKG